MPPSNTAWDQVAELLGDDGHKPVQSELPVVDAPHALSPRRRRYLLSPEALAEQLARLKRESRPNLRPADAGERLKRESRALRS